MARTRLAAAMVGAVVLIGAGCGAGSSVSDSQITSALGLKQTSDGYEMGGNPFCTVSQLLNDPGEVAGSSDETGREFEISAPKGTIGIVARKPFAPSCTRKAKAGLAKLERKANSG
jgi:hypothetical protein